MEKSTKCFFIFATVLWAAALAAPGPKHAPAAPCDPAACSLPNCLCSARTSPGGIVIGPNIPQMVLLTFDDAITPTNYPFYEEVFKDRKNPNDQPIAATFFITHEYTNYSMVHNLWLQGHDIALHSITHVSDTSYWRALDEAGWVKEVIAQRDQLATFANIPKADVKGFRAPFLQVGGNPMYAALKNGGLEWDCSRPTQQRIPGLWPYTNDYLSTQDCEILPCPNESFPGFWTVPMIDLIGGDQFPCAFVDECTPVPNTTVGTYDLLMKNFNEHYNNNNNRAPFPVYTHAAWLVGPADRPEFAARKAGYIQFLDYLKNLNDVYIVSVSQALDWVKNPTPVEEIANNNFPAWDAPIDRQPACMFPRSCRYYNSTWERFMSSCVVCPPNYPWLENPQGEIYWSDLF